MSYNTPKDILDITCKYGVKKASNNFLKTAILAFFAGMYIAFGSVGYILAVSSVSSLNNGLAVFLGASVFPVGLMMVLIAGGELFTGNVLIAVSTLQKETKPRMFIKNLAIVWVFNFLGAFFIGAITYKTHTFNSSAIGTLYYVASHKAESSFINILLKGILCNILVAGSVWASYSAKNIIGKVFIIWFPIMLFIILGYDHVVANMLYLPTALLYGSNIELIDIAKNLIAATIGNFIGGALFISALYNRAYKD